MSSQLTDRNTLMQPLVINSHHKTCLTEYEDPAKRMPEPNHERALHEANVRFKLVVAKYKLDQQADMLADILIGKPLSCQELMEKVGNGMTYDDANDFLRWIAIGIQFKEESIDPHSKNPLNTKK